MRQARSALQQGPLPVETPGLIAAINSGPKLKLVLLAGGLPSTLLQAAWAAPRPVFTRSTGYLPFTSTQGVVQTAEGEGQSAGSEGAARTSFTESGYASVEVVADAATGSQAGHWCDACCEALPKVSEFNTGARARRDADQAESAPRIQSRLFNSNYYLGVVRNRQALPRSRPKPLSTSLGWHASEALARVSQAGGPAARRAIISRPAGPRPREVSGT